jgi:hypothetical protein
MVPQQQCPGSKRISTPRFTPGILNTNYTELCMQLLFKQFIVEVGYFTNLSHSLAHGLHDFWIAAIALLADLDERINLLSLSLSNLTEQAEVGCPFLLPL